MKIFRILILFPISFLISCSGNDESFSSTNKIIEIRNYTIEVPDNFKLIEEQGYDSYVGKIQGSGIIISFDYGIYTRKEENISDEDYEVREDEFDGYSKQLLIANNPEINNTSVHIALIDQNAENIFSKAPLKMWSENLTANKQDLVVKIFESLKGN